MRALFSRFLADERGATALQGAALQAVQPRQVVAPPRLGEIQRSAIDPGRAAAEFGWRAETPLPEGIELTLGWMNAAR